MKNILITIIAVVCLLAIGCSSHMASATGSEAQASAGTARFRIDPACGDQHELIKRGIFQACGDLGLDCLGVDVARAAPDEAPDVVCLFDEHAFEQFPNCTPANTCPKRWELVDGVVYLWPSQTTRLQETAAEVARVRLAEVLRREETAEDASGARSHGAMENHGALRAPCQRNSLACSHPASGMQRDKAGPAEDEGARHASTMRLHEPAGLHGTAPAFAGIATSDSSTGGPRPGDRWKVAKMDERAKNSWVQVIGGGRGWAFA